MKTSADKTQKNKSRAVANTVSRKQSSGGTFQLVDNRPETVQLQKLQEIIANSPHAKKIAQFQEMMDNSKNPHHVQLRKMQEMIANSQLGKTAELPGVLQKKGPLDEEELQLKSKEAVQKKGPLDEEELQFKKDEAVQRKGPLDEEELQFKAEEPVRKQENRTGLPDDLKAGVENLSGLAMDDVRVHYNSGKPAQLNAYAYTQGTEIHVAPGQEKHLPHEAWHVVQQKQGRVQPTVQMAGGVAVNDDKGLEMEADRMGGEATQTQTPSLISGSESEKHQLKFDKNSFMLQFVLKDTTSELFGEDFKQHHLLLINNEEISQGIFNSRGVQSNTTFTYDSLPNKINMKQGKVKIYLSSPALYAEKVTDHTDGKEKVAIKEADGPIVVTTNNEIITHLNSTNGVKQDIKYYEYNKPNLSIKRKGTETKVPNNLLD